MMIKKFLCLGLILGVFFISGCGKTSENKKNVTVDDLNNINDTITNYFTSEKADYEGVIFNYVDEVNKIVVVGLVDNTKEKQEEFKKKVIDSDVLKFISADNNQDHQGEQEDQDNSDNQE